MSDARAGEAGGRMRLATGPSSLPQSVSDALSDSISSRSRLAAADADASSRGDDAANDDSSVQLSGIESLQIDQLVRLLSSVQPRVSQAAKEALRQRGMPEENLEMAQVLATGSAQRRQEVLSQLVQRDDLDVRPWLLWMAADGQQSVRHHAVALLTRIAKEDIDVRRQLRLLLNKERDDRVAQTIRQALVK